MADDLNDVAGRLAAPVSGLTDAELIAADRLAEQIRRVSRERAGRLLAELHLRGRSWPAIARETGLRQATAYEWAQPFLTADGPEDHHS